MYIQKNLKSILEHYKAQKSFIKNSQRIHQALEGDFLGLMEEEAQRYSTYQSRKDNAEMASSLNYMQKIVEHKSQLYTMEVERKASSGQNIVDDYIKLMQIDKHLKNANRYFNASKSILIEVYRNRKKHLAIRPIPNDKFTVWTDDQIEPNLPTAFIKIIDTVKVKQGAVEKDEDKLQIWTDEEVVLCLTNGTILSAEKNIWGRAPFVYVNQDLYNLIPRAHRDTLQNIIQINNLLTNSMVCVYYQGHPVRVLKNVDQDLSKISINPNDFVVLNSRDGSNFAPELTELAASLDISKSLMLAERLLKETLDIEDLKGEDAVQSSNSGLHLQLKNVDMTENRKSQIETFRPAEEELWDLIIHMHNKSIELKLAGPKTPTGRFDANATVEVDFPLPDTVKELQEDEDENEEEKKGTSSAQESYDENNSEE